MSQYNDTVLNRQTDGYYAKKWARPVRLTDLREVSSNNVINASGNGGLLASDTTPILEFTNGDTDSAVRLRWASSNSDALWFQLTLPDDNDTSQPIYIDLYAAMGGATDIPVIDIDTFFGIGDTKVEDASAAVTGTTAAIYTITIAASDIPKTVKDWFTMSVELTPAAHTTDTLLLYGVRVRGSRL